MSKNKTNNSNIATKSGTKQLKVIKFSVTTIGVICLLVCSFFTVPNILKYILTIFGTVMIYVGSMVLKTMSQQELTNSVMNLAQNKDFMKMVQKMMK